MDIHKIIEKDNKNDGIYLYMENFQFKAYAFSAYVLTQLFSELVMAEEIYHEDGIFVPFLSLTPRFVMENFTDCIMSANDKYIKVSSDELYNSKKMQWRKEYDEYMIERQKADNRLGSCILGFFRLG